MDKTKKTTNESTVVPFKKEKKGDERVLSKKWGAKVVEHGYTSLPSLLITHQARLGLSAVQMMVLIHIVEHWWKDKSMPFPSKKTIATRMGISERQVQRHLTDLETGGFIERVQRYYPSGGQRSNAYNLDGLVGKLRKLEPEYRKTRERQRRMREESETPKSKRLRR